MSEARDLIPADYDTFVEVAKEERLKSAGAARDLDDAAAESECDARESPKNPNRTLPKQAARRRSEAAVSPSASVCCTHSTRQRTRTPKSSVSRAATQLPPPPLLLLGGNVNQYPMLRLFDTDGDSVQFDSEGARDGDDDSASVSASGVADQEE